MINQPTNNWSLCVGQPGGVELRVHILLPLVALIVLLAVNTNIASLKVPLTPDTDKSVMLSVESSLVDPFVAMWAIGLFVTSVALHELIRAMTAVRVGGHPISLVLGPIGGLTKLHLPSDPPAHLATALSGPMTYLILLVGAGCGLALSGDSDVLRLLLNPCLPKIDWSPSMPTIYLVAQLTVWINWCLLIISLLPIDPCDGAELLRGILWPIVGRPTATSVTSRVALGTAAFVALFAVLLPENYSSGPIPTWFPLAVIALFLVYGGYQTHNARYYDAGLAIDEFDSDDEEWLPNAWDEEDREAVLVEHLQDKQQEALDRKRREQEANEDAQVDAILMRLRDTSFEQLSEDDRATLKRAARRYRERRAEQDDH